MKAVRERNKDQERDKRSSRRKKTVLRKKRHGYCRNRDDIRHDTFGGTIGFLRARLEVIDLTEVNEPAVAEPFYPTPKGGQVRIFEGEKPTKAAKRRSGRSAPWDDADEPWPGRSRSFIYA